MHNVSQQKVNKLNGKKQKRQISSLNSHHIQVPTRNKKKGREEERRSRREKETEMNNDI